MDAVNDVAKRPYQRWPAGVSGNPGGRPLGARGAFSEEFMRTLRKVWQLEGETAMMRTAKENPTAFTALCGRLLPAEVSAVIQTQAPILDADDLAILRAIKLGIPDAGNRSPDEILSFTLAAIRAHSAQLIPQRIKLKAQTDKSLI